MVTRIVFGPIERDERLTTRTENESNPRRRECLDIDSLIAQVPIYLFHSVPRFDFSNFGIGRADAWYPQFLLPAMADQFFLGRI